VKVDKFGSLEAMSKIMEDFFFFFFLFLGRPEKSRKFSLQYCKFLFCQTWVLSTGAPGKSLTEICDLPDVMITAGT
jgi:hypothetical protein